MDTKKPRHLLFVEASLGVGAVIACSRDQADYLSNVLRLTSGDKILVFDGSTGEWLAKLAKAGRGACELEIIKQVRKQIAGPDLFYLFAPLKRARLDYMVQKATEMGVSHLVPVLTNRTQVTRLNVKRMRANAIEAAEQCGILRVPAALELQALRDVLANWDTSRRLIYCDEALGVADPFKALSALKASPLALLIGPEGGFDAEERESLRAKSFVTPISLGPRVMRADTAAVAALGLINAVLGDWR